MVVGLVALRSYLPDKSLHFNQPVLKIHTVVTWLFLHVAALQGHERPRALYHTEKMLSVA